MIGNVVNESRLIDFVYSICYRLGDNTHSGKVRLFEKSGDLNERGLNNGSEMGI